MDTKYKNLTHFFSYHLGGRLNLTFLLIRNINGHSKNFLGTQLDIICQIVSFFVFQVREENIKQLAMMLNRGLIANIMISRYWMAFHERMPKVQNLHNVEVLHSIDLLNISTLQYECG